MTTTHTLNTNFFFNPLFNFSSLTQIYNHTHTLTGHYFSFFLFNSLITHQLTHTYFTHGTHFTHSFAHSNSHQHHKGTKSLFIIHKVGLLTDLDLSRNVQLFGAASFLWACSSCRELIESRGVQSSPRGGADVFHHMFNICQYVDNEHVHFSCI